MSILTKMPVVFISHGSPLAAIEHDSYTRALHRMGEDLPRPRAIVVVSAHWESVAPIRVGMSERPPLIYDFGGFPAELYELKYACPGDRGLSDDILALLKDAGVKAVGDPARGLDHGAWVPLMHAYPGADIPVVEVTLPVPRKPSEMLALGAALAPLRDRGVLLIGSGGIVHNLHRVRFEDKDAPIESWALSFDDWVRARLETQDVSSLSDYRNLAPEASAAVPTSEHFDPLFVVLGASGRRDRVKDLYEGFQYGNLSLRTFAVTESALQKR